MENWRNSCRAVWGGKKLENHIFWRIDSWKICEFVIRQKSQSFVTLLKFKTPDLMRLFDRGQKEANWVRNDQYSVLQKCSGLFSFLQEQASYICLSSYKSWIWTGYPTKYLTCVILTSPSAFYLLDSIYKSFTLKCTLLSNLRLLWNTIEK